MTIRKLAMAGTAFAAILSAPAIAQAPPAGSAAPAPAATAPAAGAVTPTVGAQVVDAQGGVVGTIDSVSGTTAVVNTGMNKAAIPFASFGKGDKGLVLGMTKAELDSAASAATADATAAFAAKLKAGTPVTDSSGAPLGTIEANDGSLVTLARTSGKVKLPVTAFGPSASGGVQIGMTTAQLDDAAKQAGAAPPASAAGSAASGTAPETAEAAEPAETTPQR